MAKGKGEIKGWITRNGIHIPIYGTYTVRGGVEPTAKGSKFKGKKKKWDDSIRKSSDSYFAAYSSAKGEEKGVKDLERRFDSKEEAEKFLQDREDQKAASKKWSVEKKGESKYDYNTGKGDYGDYVKSKSVSGLEEGLKSKGLTMDSADRHYMETARPGDEDKITVWDKDGNKYTGTFNKYSDGGVELVDMKKSAKKTPSMTAESGKDDLVNRVNAKTAEKLAEHDTRRAEEETKQRASDHTEEGPTRSKAVNDYLSNKDGRREAFNKELNERYGDEKMEPRASAERQRDVAEAVGKVDGVDMKRNADRTLMGMDSKNLSDDQRRVVDKEASKNKWTPTPEDRALENNRPTTPETSKRDYSALKNTASNGAPRVSDDEAKANKSVTWNGQEYQTQPVVDWDREKNQEYTAGHLYVPVNPKGDARQFFVANEDGSVHQSGSEYLRQKNSKGQESSRPDFSKMSYSQAGDYISKNKASFGLTDNDDPYQAAYQLKEGNWSVGSDGKIKSEHLEEQRAWDKKMNERTMARRREFQAEQESSASDLHSRIQAQAEQADVHRQRTSVKKVPSPRANANGNESSGSKASIPTTVSGLRSAYAEATGSEKAKISAELRRKGYSLVGGKWVKGR